jgi:hypothetical protein
MIVTGMHRSGTSLIASLIKVIGVELGDRLYQADCFNVKGYFEDLDFLEFQRSLLQESCPPGVPGWPDWGWTEAESLNQDHFQTGLTQAQGLIDQRNAQGGIWGWKDPRTSLMLDFWQQLLPEARFLFVYRLPWDVADSILRLNSGIFSQRPDYAIRSWAYYNRHILDFYQRYPSRCLLVNINSLLAQPTKLVHLLQNKLDIPVKSDLDDRAFQRIYDPNLFKQLSGDRPLVQFLQHPDLPYLSVLEQLDWAADLPSHFTPQATSNELPLEIYPLWLHHEAVQAKIQLAALTDSLPHSRDLTAECDQLRAQIAWMETSKFWKIKVKWSNFKGAVARTLNLKPSQL